MKQFFSYRLLLYFWKLNVSIVNSHNTTYILLNNKTLIVATYTYTSQYTLIGLVSHLANIKAANRNFILNLKVSVLTEIFSNFQILIVCHIVYFNSYRFAGKCKS